MAGETRPLPPAESMRSQRAMSRTLDATAPPGASAMRLFGGGTAL